LSSAFGGVAVFNSRIAGELGGREPCGRETGFVPFLVPELSRGRIWRRGSKNDAAGSSASDDLEVGKALGHPDFGTCSE